MPTVHVITVERCPLSGQCFSSVVGARSAPDARGWSVDEYTDFLVDAVARLLLD
jgi:hypothetical protein